MASNVSGYYIFTPTFICAEGTLSGCKDGPVEDRTAITICAPDTFGSTGSKSPDGGTNFLSTDPETAKKVTSNPAATASPIVSSSDSNSAAGRMLLLDGGLKVLGVGFWLAVCTGLGGMLI